MTSVPSILPGVSGGYLCCLPFAPRVFSDLHTAHPSLYISILYDARSITFALKDQYQSLTVRNPQLGSIE